MIELLDAPDQADRSLLYEILELEPATLIVGSDRHHQREVRLDQLLPGSWLALPHRDRERPFFFCAETWD